MGDTEFKKSLHEKWDKLKIVQCDAEIAKNEMLIEAYKAIKKRITNETPFACDRVLVAAIKSDAESIELKEDRSANP